MTRHLLRNLFLAVVLTASAFGLNGSSPATAGLLPDPKACFELAEGAAQIAEAAGEVAACGTQASDDPVLVAITVVLAALAAEGEFDSKETCHAMIDNAAAGFLADSLLGLGIMGQGTADAIKAAVAKGDAEEVEAFFSDNPIVGEEIACGCAIAGNPVAVGKMIVALQQEAQACGGVAGDVAAAFVDSVESGPDAAKNYFEGIFFPGLTNQQSTCPNGGAPTYQTAELDTCVPGKFAVKGAPVYVFKNPAYPVGQGFSGAFGRYEACPSQWMDTCGVCDADATGHGADDPHDYPGADAVSTPNGGICMCGPPAQMVLDGASGAYCKCPSGLGYSPQGTCEVCAQGTIGSNGQCGPCPSSTKPDGKGKCIPACGPGRLFNLNGPQPDACDTCPKDSVPLYPDLNKSLGTCRACPADETANPGDAVCVNRCSDPSQQQWKDGFCENKCPNDRHARPVGDTTDFVCIACDLGTAWNNKKDSCEACPKGATADTGPLGPYCTCPKGQANEKGVCKVCQGTITTSDSGGTCNACPDSSHWVWDQYPKSGHCFAERKPLSCGMFGIPDPQRPDLACVPCPAGQIAANGACVKSPSAVRPPPDKVSPPANKIPDGAFKPLICPPGYHTAVTRCEADAVPDNKRPPLADCSKLGPNYYKDKDNPNACLRCNGGSKANRDLDGCQVQFKSPLTPNGNNTIGPLPPTRSDTPLPPPPETRAGPR